MAVSLAQFIQGLFQAALISLGAEQSINKSSLQISCRFPDFQEKLWKKNAADFFGQ
jgi:hypothetical protein